MAEVTRFGCKGHCRSTLRKYPVLRGEVKTEANAIGNRTERIPVSLKRASTISGAAQAMGKFVFRSQDRGEVVLETGARI